MMTNCFSWLLYLSNRLLECNWWSNLTLNFSILLIRMFPVSLSLSLAFLSLWLLNCKLYFVWKIFLSASIPAFKKTFMWWWRRRRRRCGISKLKVWDRLLNEHLIYVCWGKEREREMNTAEVRLRGYYVGKRLFSDIVLVLLTYFSF